jgi:hypothetical protein
LVFEHLLARRISQVCCQIVPESNGTWGKKNMFKNQIRKVYDMPDKPPLYFSTGIIIANILHARLRQKCSSLTCDLSSNSSSNFCRFQEAFPNNIFSMPISKSKLLMPRNSCILCSVYILHFKNKWSKVWRYQRGNQKPYIEEEQTTQWRKEKVQKDKQRTTKHTYKTKNRVTRTPLKTGGELRYSGRVSSSCSPSGTRRVNEFLSFSRGISK